MTQSFTMPAPGDITALHLADAGTCPTRYALMGLAMRRLPGRHRAIIVGSRQRQRQATAAGVPQSVRVSGAFGRAAAGLAGLQRALRAMDQPQVVHCWSIGAAWAAAALTPTLGRVIHITHAPAPNELRWLCRLTRWPIPGRSLVAVTDATLAERVIAGGMDQDAVRIVPPAVDPSLVEPGERAQVRRRWGLGDEVDGKHPRTVVVALLSDPPGRVDSRPGGLALGLVRECLKGQTPPLARVRLLVHPTQRSRDITLGLMRDFQWHGGLIQDAQLTAPWRVLPACDLAIAHAEHGSRLSALWAMRLGVPLVAGHGGALTAGLTHDRDALLADPKQPRSFGDRVLRLTRDPGRAAELATNAQRYAAEHFGTEAMIDALMEVQASVIAAPVASGCSPACS